MSWLLRIVCPHRVLIYERRGLVCQTCGTTFRHGDLKPGRHAALQRSHR